MPKYVSLNLDFRLKVKTILNTIYKYKNYPLSYKLILLLPMPKIVYMNAYGSLIIINYKSILLLHYYKYSR